MILHFGLVMNKNKVSINSMTIYSYIMIRKAEHPELYFQYYFNWSATEGTERIEGDRKGISKLLLCLLGDVG